MLESWPQGKEPIPGDWGEAIPNSIICLGGSEWWHELQTGWAAENINRRLVKGRGVEVSPHCFFLQYKISMLAYSVGFFSSHSSLSSGPGKHEFLTSSGLQALMGLCYHAPQGPALSLTSLHPSGTHLHK